MVLSSSESGQGLISLPSKLHAVKLNHEDGHHTEVLDVVGSYENKLALRLCLSLVGKQSTMLSQPPGKSLNLLSTRG